MKTPQSPALRRRVGVVGAVFMGLGSIVGTGAFVSLGLAADIAGPAMLMSLLVAGALALLNGLSSAQLAAAYPVSGGTYEYANRTLGPKTGFTAGWMFLTAKSASAATAALGLSSYLLSALGLPSTALTAVALGCVALLTAVVYGGIQRSSRLNGVLISITLLTLAALIAVGLWPALSSPAPNPAVPGANGLPTIAHAAALLFVAFTGYGRIATLGEEVIAPKRTIPRAIAVALLVAVVLYAGIAATALGVLGAAPFAQLTHSGAAPLTAVATTLGHPWLATALSIAAVTAMAGVMLNLLLGLSRVLLAMARRRDAPAVFARIDHQHATPSAAVLMTGATIGALVLIGDIRTTWSFSALSVLVYYAITNAAALRLPAANRLYPRWMAAVGLLSCIGLAGWIEPMYWLVGGLLLALGHALRAALKVTRPHHL